MDNKENNQDGYPQELEYGEYVYVKELARGGQGSVCLFKRVKDNKVYAVKFDPPNHKDSNIIGECLFLKEHGIGQNRLPNYIKHTTIKGRRFMIQEYLEKSVREHI
jgi:hypothetical protein